MVFLAVLLVSLQIQIPYRLNPDAEFEEEYIYYASPMEFEHVPVEIKDRLTQLECTIPQPGLGFNLDQLHNLVSGEFGQVGQTDWAAVCSRKGRSEILVLWGGREHCQSIVVAERLDSVYTQMWGPNGMGYSRLISSFSPSQERLFKIDDDLPERTHEAIQDYFMDKAGTSFYCHEGKWVEFGTSD